MLTYLPRESINNMKIIFISNNIHLHLKIRLLKCYVFPVLLFGVEIWTMTETSIEKALRIVNGNIIYVKIDSNFISFHISHVSIIIDLILRFKRQRFTVV